MEQRRSHYDVETELAARLRNSSRQERRSLYTALYDELYERVPDHPLLTRPASAEETDRQVSAQLRLIRPFLGPDTTFLEIGAGDCALSRRVSQIVKHVYGVEVSDTVAGHADLPANFQFVFSDGSSIPVPPNSIDVAYSNQVMEHLHVDDAADQLRNILAALAPGGIYICVTPNRLNGPHDISRYFDKVATGLHLKEYSTGELDRLFREVGFSKTTAHAEIRGVGFAVPVPVIVFWESVLDRLPRAMGSELAGMPLVRKFLGVQLTGTK
jgi:SAM-dependent methyltransferase